MELIPEYTMETRNTGAGYVCSLCGAARRAEDKIIRLEYIDMEGWFDICSTCVVEMGDLVGLYSGDKVAKMSAELLRLRAQNTSLQARIDDGTKVLTR